MKKAIIVILSSIVMTFSLCSISYARHDHGGQLPPGLQKKADRGQSLPPGWQKKLVRGKVLEKDIYEQGKIISTDTAKGTITVSINGKLVKLVKDTREIVDILSGN